MTKIKDIAAAVLFTILAGLPAAGNAQAACISGQEGRQLLEQGQVVPFPEAMRQAGLKRDEVVDVQLCEGGGGFVYRVRVLQPGGRVRSMNIPAG
ncbi:MAG: hypothetical protein H0T75_00715 [Rhizobiales bacterium]|jgi:hypothetical protein|nr:hypothetical protein [Hyphomicrobiales bacterium]MDQ3558007.1 hypothetical protein [Pseudomonadota bacterium]